MNHHSSSQVRPRLIQWGSASFLVLAACGSELDRSQFGPAPSSSSGMAGWVVNGEGGETSSLGGSGGRRAGTGGSSVGSKAGSSGISGPVDGEAGSASTPATSGGSAGVSGAAAFGQGGASGTSGISPDLPPGGEGGAPAEPPPKVHAFLLSEYVEGSSNNKAIEIHATEASTLDGCELRFYFNGGAEPSRLTLDGFVPAGHTYAVCTEELAVQIAPRCARSASLRFNGNDAVSLACDGVVIDTFGQVGSDPGKAWGSGDSATVDHTLRRKCDASADAIADDAFEPALAWDAFPIDHFDDLGERECEPDSGAAGAGGHAGDAGHAGETSDSGQSGAAGLERH